MFRIFKLFVTDAFSTLTRHLFWLYKLSSSNIGKSVTIEFPVKREGSGEFRLGDFGYLGRYCNIGIAESSKFEAMANVHIASKSTILINKNCSLKVGSNFKLGESARMYIQNNWHFGNDVKIETHCAIFAREPGTSGKLVIGNGSHIGDYSVIDLVNDVTLGNDVALGPNCTLYTHDHGYTNKNVAAWKGEIVSKPIVINDGAWIGSGVTILPGVIIGKRSVVAAGSVVTKNVEAETIWGGIPAKLIKTIT